MTAKLFVLHHCCHRRGSYTKKVLTGAQRVNASKSTGSQFFSWGFFFFLPVHHPYSARLSLQCHGQRACVTWLHCKHFLNNVFHLWVVWNEENFRNASNDHSQIRLNYLDNYWMDCVKFGSGSRGLGWSLLIFAVSAGQNLHSSSQSIAMNDTPNWKTQWNEMKQVLMFVFLHWNIFQHP